MNIQELHKAVLTALSQELSAGADSVHLTKYTEDDYRIEAVINFEHSSSFGRLDNLNDILSRFGLEIGEIYFGSPTEIHVESWVRDCRFKTAIAEACSIFGLFTEDDQTIKDDLEIEDVGKIIACAMKHKEL